MLPKKTKEEFHNVEEEHTRGTSPDKTHKEQHTREIQTNHIKSEEEIYKEYKQAFREKLKKELEASNEKINQLTKKVEAIEEKKKPQPRFTLIERKARRLARERLGLPALGSVGSAKQKFDELWIDMVAHPEKYPEMQAETMTDELFNEEVEDESVIAKLRDNPVLLRSYLPTEMQNKVLTQLEELATKKFVDGEITEQEYNDLYEQIRQKSIELNGSTIYPTTLKKIEKKKKIKKVTTQLVR